MNDWEWSGGLVDRAITANGGEYSRRHYL